MRRKRLVQLSARYAAAIAVVLVSSSFLSAQNQSALSAKAKAKAQWASGTPTPTLYNPYPRGILPADLDSEIARVRREVAVIFNRYLKQARALTKPIVTGNPPTIQGSGYEAVRILGGLLNYDEKMAPFKNEACAFCHMPYAGFGPPIPSVNLTMIGYPGSFRFRAGKRNPQRYTYSPRFPVFHLNGTRRAPNGGTFTGGNFWDARSTGYKLQSPDAEQAQHPPVDTQEMGLPDTACIAFRLQTAPYRSLFEQVWGAGSLDIKFPNDAEQICDTPGGAAVFGTDVQPIKLNQDDRTKADRVYDNWGQSISFLESSNDVSPFTSKIDASLENPPAYTFTATEAVGRAVFQGKGNCNSCHLNGLSTKLLPSQRDTGTPANAQPLFTCFGYANLGLPLNPRDAFYYQTTPDFFGFTGNPLGFGYRDLGLGTFLRSGFGSGANPNTNFIPLAPKSDGQMQTSTIRDVAMTPPQCPTTEAGQFDSNGKPIPYFQKEFFHNGYIKSLKQLVHFYNTRDVYAFNVTSGHCPDGTIEKVNCWPMAEVPNNIDMTVGNLGLTDEEENDLVTVMQAATDGFMSPYPHIDTFTGTCQTGGSAATQGNETLIPAPDPLPTCASAVCGVEPTPEPSVSRRPTR